MTETTVPEGMHGIHMKIFMPIAMAVNGIPVAVFFHGAYFNGKVPAGEGRR